MVLYPNKLPESERVCSGICIGHFRRYVPERLLNAKVVVFLGFLWFTVDFYSLKGVGWWKIGHKTGYLLWNIYDSLEKVWGNR